VQSGPSAASAHPSLGTLETIGLALIADLVQDGRMRIIAYTRVSTSEQAHSGLGLAAQRSSILREAKARGWDLASIEWIEDAGFSAKSLRRPGLTIALDALKTGDAGVLVVAKTDRLSRSLLDFTSILQRAQKQGWILVALDSPADLSTPQGEAMVSVLAVFSQLERRLIGERTKACLAEARAAGTRLGRPKVLTEDVIDHVVALHAETGSYSAAARQLQAEGVPTAHGGQWQPTTVRKLVLSKSVQP
jgi:DNA invertase Pin-like site-specific DNA recombinase